MIKNKQSNQIEVIDFIKEAHEHQEGKVCTKCNKHQPLSEFYKKRSSADGFRNDCKSCVKEYKDNMCPFVKWFTLRKSQAKVKGKEFTIEPTDIPGVKIEQVINVVTIPSPGNTNIMIKKRFTTWKATEYPKVCPVLGTELDWKKKVNGGQNNSPSLDRIDSTKDYIPGNVMIMSMLANKMKSDSTLEQKKTEARYYLLHQPLHTNLNQVELFGNN